MEKEYAASNREAPPGSPSASDASAPDAKSSKSAPETSAEERAARAAEREAEFQKKQAAYEVALAEQQKQVADFEQARADVAAKKEEQRKQVEAAQADFARQQEEHRREVERLAQQGFAEQARYALCLGGDQKACADMEAGVPVNVELAEAKAPEASTDHDARTCVTEPVVSGTSTKGQMQAVVFNGCLKPVDLRICLLRTGGWNCGVEWGLKPQQRWTHTSFETSGEIFWDARTSGVERPLAMPK